MALQRDHFGRRVDAGNVQSVIGDAESGFYFLFQLLVRFAFGSEPAPERLLCCFWSFGIVVSFQLGRFEVYLEMGINSYRNLKKRAAISDRPISPQVAPSS